MKLLSLNKKILSLFFLFFFSTPLLSEDSVDIWGKKNLNKKTTINEAPSVLEKEILKTLVKTEAPSIVEIDTKTLSIKKKSIYGIFEPAENNLTLDMWANSEGTKIKDTIERINKIKLSSYAEEIFVNTLFTISDLPQKNMTDKEFINYKLDWLIDNQKENLISTFLNKNKEFPNKKKIIKYLVDKNIAKADTKEACKNITLINNEIKDSYLEQFKIICLINNNKKNEAMLIYDLLREQKLSNKFFDSKINYLLGINTKADNKINDTSLLNFYLSSITASEFNYKPNKKTDKKIWQYLTAANLLKINNFENNQQIKELEIAANNNNLSKNFIFEIYTNMRFGFNDFLNIETAYLNLDSISARALVYQKILLSDNIETKLKYLFLLNDLFKKDNLSNIFKGYLEQELESIDSEKIPAEYKNFVDANTTYHKINKLGKIKYQDDKYYSSKVVRFYTESNTTKKKTSKDLASIYKKIKKKKNYQISLKDVVLFESLESDGFTIPEEINYKEIQRNNLPPMELLNFAKNKEIGLLLLKIVELIGEDEISDLDSHTIYFINHLFIKANLKKFKNKILFLVLPERTEI